MTRLGRVYGVEALRPVVCVQVAAEPLSRRARFWNWVERQHLVESAYVAAVAMLLRWWWVVQ